ncbi:MAG: ATP-binding protein [Bacteroidales bacterium]|nr:ATP-binding protein [Bacteroidales bacterium]
MQTTARKYPVGIQTFERLRKENYLYIDKTDLVWKMTKESPYVFLSRPRRFGKSLLTTTLDSYFQGRKNLFEGLKIMDLETEWEQYPVIHLDLSVTKTETTVEGLRNVLFRLLEGYKAVYGEGPYETTPGGLFSGIIHRAYRQTGKQVAIIIDEYDAPLLDKLHIPDLLNDFRVVMQEFFVQLKANEAMIRFCFITGITKFSQLSIFSTINNLTNISMDPKYAALCGITEDEFATDMAPDIAMLAEEYGCTPEEMRAKLKQQYDGYRFAKESPDIYNPFSLLKCVNQKDVANYWFESGTPTFLIRQMQHYRTDIMALDSMEVPSAAFDRPTEAMEDALPLLYQSGYVTIKDYERESQMYTLGIPNKEVRVGFTEGLLPTYIGLRGSDVQVGFAVKFWRALKKNDIDLAMSELKAFLAGVPYVEGFQKKLEEVKNYEGFYEYTFWLIFNMLNVYARTQVKCANGRIDFVVQMPDTTYVFELKVNGTAQEAMDQINGKGYALPYQTEGKAVVKVGVQFDRDTMTVGEYMVER